MKIIETGLLAAGVCACLCAAPRIASAQTMQWTDKGYVTVSGGAQVGSDTLDTSSTFDIYGEGATVTTTQKVKGGGFFDIGAAYRVWGNNLLAGVSVSHTSSDTTMSLHASVPDPLFFDRPRTVDSSQSGVKHSENVVHLDAIWMIPVANKIDVGVFAGPSIFAVKQDIVSNLGVSETANPAQPAISAPLTSVKKTTAGINLGVDVQYMVVQEVGRRRSRTVCVGVRVDSGRD